MKDSIKKEIRIAHPIQDVWNAITRQDELSEWFVNADFRPEIGYAYTFTSKGDDCSMINGIVKKADPYTLIYTWVVAGTDVETLVKWTLEATQGGTNLVVEHTGISKYEAATAIQMFEGFEKGWKKCMADLNAYCSALVK